MRSHWRHYHMALVMVKLLIRNDIPLPGPAVHMLVNHLVHDTLNVRKVGISFTTNGSFLFCPLWKLHGSNSFRNWGYCEGQPPEKILFCINTPDVIPNHNSVLFCLVLVVHHPEVFCICTGSTIFKGSTRLVLKFSWHLKFVKKSSRLVVHVVSHVSAGCSKF